MEIEPHIGVGPLKLHMSQADIASVLGSPDDIYTPSDDEIFDRCDLKFYRNQVIELRKSATKLDLLDLTFENGRLVCINMAGRSQALAIKGMLINGDRLELLSHVAAIDPDVYIRSENYAFMGTGLCLSRARNRSGMNYVRLYTPDFKRKRLAYELYKAHSGPIIP